MKGKEKEKELHAEFFLVWNIKMKIACQLGSRAADNSGTINLFIC